MGKKNNRHTGIIDEGEDSHYKNVDTEGFDVGFHNKGKRTKVIGGKHATRSNDEQDARQIFNVKDSQMHFGRGDNSQEGPSSNEQRFLSKYWWSFLIPLIVIVLGFVITEGKIPGILDGLSEIVRDTADAKDDLRTQLVGFESIFDLVSTLHTYDTQIQRDEFIENHKGREFEASVNIFDLGKFSDGTVWASVQGTTFTGETQYFECHFDKTWESTLKNIFDTGQRNLKLNGEVAYYSSGWVVAEKCEVIDVET